MAHCEISRPFPNTIIRASAGTGKTFQLAHRFLALLHAGERPDHILAATFARKAAGEILDRVVTRLAEAADDPAVLADLQTHIRRPVDAGPLDGRRCVQLLRDIVNHLHRLRIGTLDSFFIQIAGTLGLDLGLPPGWSILDEVEDDVLRDLAVQEVLADGSLSELVALMRLLGKGHVISSVHRQIRFAVGDAYAIYRETTPEEHRGGPPECWRRIPRHRPLGVDELQAAIDALADAERPDDKRFVSAVAANVEAAEADDWEGFLERGLAPKVAAGETTYYRKPIPPGLVTAYIPLIEHAKAQLVGRLANQTEATWRLLEKFHQAYARLKFDRRGLRFEDVTALLAETIGRFDEAHLNDLNYRLDMHVCQMLLDEFQDTSLAQWSVVRPFAESVQLDGQRSIFCVGDVKQAIYGWRGGVSELFDHVERQIEGVQVEPLDVSYRSSRVIMETVNRVFGSLPTNEIVGRRFPDVAATWAGWFQEHSTALDLPGYAVLQTARLAEEDEDAQQVTLGDAAALVARLHRECPEMTIGVLTRRNAAVGRLIHDLRKTHGVAASEEGGNPLVDSPAVTLVLSLLTIGDHPGDTIARYHVGRSPLGELVGLTDWQDDGRAAALSLEIRQSLLEHGYGRTIYRWVQRLAPLCDRRDLRRLMQLVELAYLYEPRATEQCEDFLRTVAARKVEDPSGARVRVMNVHQSKGLEFDIVVLPEMDVPLIPQGDAVLIGRDAATDPVHTVSRSFSQKLLPLLPPRFETMLARSRDREVGESLCLLYVAMTRAVHALHMLVAPRPDGKSFEQKFSGVVLATLGDGSAATAPQAVLWEHGERDWHRHVERPSVAGESKVESLATDAETITVRLRPTDGRVPRSRPRVAPSALEGGELVDLTSRPTAAAKIRGVLWHAWLERVGWIEDGLPDDEALLRIAKRHPHAGLDLPTEVKDFRRALAQPKVRRRLSRNAYLDATGIWPPAVAGRVCECGDPPALWTEREFAVRDGDALLSGKIDRLVLFCGEGRPVAADLLDYKTELVTADDLSERIAYYRPQQDAYRRAVGRIYGLPAEAVAVRLLFLRSGVAATVP